MFVHIVNTDMYLRQHIDIDLGESRIESIKMHMIAKAPLTEITVDNMDVFKPQAIEISKNSIDLPGAAVAAIEITLK